MSAKNKESANKSIRRKSDRKMKFISWYYKLTESAILNYLKMPSTPYDLVRDDQDLRIPLHAEQAFFNGISFPAKVSSMRGSKPFRFYFILFFLFFVAAPFDFQMLELPWFFSICEGVLFDVTVLIEFFILFSGVQSQTMRAEYQRFYLQRHTSLIVFVESNFQCCYLYQPPRYSYSRSRIG